MSKRAKKEHRVQGVVTAGEPVKNVAVPTEQEMQPGSPAERTGIEPLPQNPDQLEDLNDEIAGEIDKRPLRGAPKEQLVDRPDALRASGVPDRRDDHPVAPEPQVVPDGDEGIMVTGPVDSTTGKIIDQVTRLPANEHVDQARRRKDGFAPLKGEQSPSELA